MSDVKFIDGMFAKEPHEKVKSFVPANISIKKEVFQAWLAQQNGEWVNIDVKISKSGKWYCQLNEYKPKEKPEEYRATGGYSTPPPAPADDLPF